LSKGNHEAELRSLLADVCARDVSEIKLDDDLVSELGLDSLAGLRVLAAVEKRFDVQFPDHRLGEFRTMKQLLEIIEGE
jgi:acyl carrier protein